MLTRVRKQERGASGQEEGRRVGLPQGSRAGTERAEAKAKLGGRSKSSALAAG